ncbi:hypothetical protein [Mycobacterium sp. UM_CSW]|uniref:hypothetical protein n=1 Tax=Mycobacterium sp. UM_CSW TaxID=1370119 RepID=UPI001267B0BF|nr:hypothetical protein [Mycobacterium sp. UM_CSW]
MRVTYPAFWKSPKLANLADDWDARLVLAGLWSYVEDNGVGLDNAGLIAAQLFAFDDPATVVPRVAKAVDRLHAKGHVRRYEADVEGVRLKLIEVADWSSWQKPDKPTPSPYPPSTSANAVESDSRAAREPFATNSRQEGGDRSLELGVRRGVGRAAREPSANHSRDPHAPPPRKCPKHIDDPTSPKCGACKDSRLAFEAWEREHPALVGADAKAGEWQAMKERREHKARIAACQLCDENGMRERGSALARCDHTPDYIDGEVIP